MSGSRDAGVAAFVPVSERTILSLTSGVRARGSQRIRTGTAASKSNRGARIPASGMSRAAKNPKSRLAMPAASRSARSAASSASSSGVTFEQRDRLDVRRVRKHADGPRAPQLVAPVLGELLDVPRQRRRVAGDVDDARRADAPQAAD